MVIVLAHPGDEGVVLVVLQGNGPGEQEVDEAAVVKGEAKVVLVALDEGIGLDRRGFDDAVELHPLILWY